MSFKIPDRLIHTKTGQAFLSWSKIYYTSCLSTTEHANYACLLRQKINNLYTKYFDPEVVLNPEYMVLLKYPKKLYLEWTGGNLDLDAAELTILLDAKKI